MPLHTHTKHQQNILKKIIYEYKRDIRVNILNALLCHQNLYDCHFDLGNVILIKGEYSLLKDALKLKLVKTEEVFCSVIFVLFFFIRSSRS